MKLCFMHLLISFRWNIEQTDVKLWPKNSMKL